jgi:hypothetical protein
VVIEAALLAWVLLGVRYPSDVVAAVLLGTLLAVGLGTVAGGSEVMRSRSSTIPAPRSNGPCPARTVHLDQVVGPHGRQGWPQRVVADRR